MPRDSRSSSFVPALGAAAVLFGGMAWYMHRVEREAVSVGASQLAAMIDAPHPVAEVAKAVASLKLVTVEIDSKVRVDRGDENWRGVVQASVEVPVRLRYGVNLEDAGAVRVVYSPIADEARGVMVISVPEPVLLGTEVFSEKESVEVKTGGLRLRSRAGEYFLGIARRDVAETARALTLRPEDADKVRGITRGQVEELAKKLVGDGVAVRVRFTERAE